MTRPKETPRKPGRCHSDLHYPKRMHIWTFSTTAERERLALDRLGLNYLPGLLLPRLMQGQHTATLGRNRAEHPRISIMHRPSSKRLCRIQPRPTSITRCLNPRNSLQGTSSLHA
jgi:hypothetical protein